MSLTLTSAAFDSGETIPAEYTCDGANISPPLAWTDVPREAESLVLICDDPDSTNGPWSHWVIYDIPTERNGLKEDVPAEGRLPWGALQGRNDFGNVGYGGPCPSPPGATHHYYFRLYALDKELDIEAGATRIQVLNHMEGHILEQTELVGLFARS